jgi:uncharacterized protein
MTDVLCDRLPIAATPKKRRFFQFTLRQILLLFAVSSILLGIVTPRIRRTFQERRLDHEAARRAAARADLATAVRANNVALARQALEAGAEPDLGGMLPNAGPFLYACIVKGQVEIMELLLDFGADVERIENFPDPFPGPFRSGPPLFAAAGCDQPPDVRCQMIRLLVSRGADPRRQLYDLTAMEAAFQLSDAQTGELLRELGLPYGPREMAAFNRLDELKRAITRAPEILDERFQTIWAAPPGHGPTLLAIALERGYREMAVFLLNSGASVDTVLYRGLTLLHVAARGGDPELIDLLVGRGLDVNATNVYSDTPLSDIAGRDKPRAVAALLEAGSDVNHHGMHGYTPLHRAILGNCTDIVQMLLASGADPNRRDSKEQNALDLARTRNPAMAKLIERHLSQHGL